MGPSDKQPVLPRYQCLETMDEENSSKPTTHRSAAADRPSFPATGCSIFENVVDPTTSRSCTGRSAGRIHQHDGLDAGSEVRDLAARRHRSLDPPSGRWQDFPSGDGSSTSDVARGAKSAVAQFARVESIGWTLPIDDTSFRIYVAGRVKQSGDIGRMRSKFNGKFWWI